MLWFKVRQDYKVLLGSLYSIKVPYLKHKIWLRAGTSDLMVFRQICCSGETEFELGEELTPPHFIVDAGANIGLSSIIFAIRWPNSKIIALEIDSENYSLLCKNIAQYSNVIPLKKALWGTDGYVRISTPTAEPWAFQVVQTEKDDPAAIEAISLGQILTENGEKIFSLLKIDIEGAEIDVLQSNTSNWIDNTKTIAIELHDRFRPGCTAALDRLLSGRQYNEKQPGEHRIINFL